MSDNEREEEAAAALVVEALGGPEEILRMPLNLPPAAEERPVRGGWGP